MTFICRGELIAAAKALFRLRGASKELVVLTGFPCLLDFDIPTETDGPVRISSYFYFTLIESVQSHPLSL